MNRRVRAVVAWQATVLVTTALLAGIPLGLLAGRELWIVFARGLGVEPLAQMPWLDLVVLVPVVLVVANLIAALPSAAAVRHRPAAVFQDE